MFYRLPLWQIFLHKCSGTASLGSSETFFPCKSAVYLPYNLGLNATCGLPHKHVRVSIVEGGRIRDRVPGNVQR